MRNEAEAEARARSGRAQGRQAQACGLAGQALPGRGPGPVRGWGPAWRWGGVQGRGMARGVRAWPEGNVPPTAQLLPPAKWHRGPWGSCILLLEGSGPSLFRLLTLHEARLPRARLHARPTQGHLTCVLTRREAPAPGTCPSLEGRQRRSRPPHPRHQDPAC